MLQSGEALGDSPYCSLASLTGDICVADGMQRVSPGAPTRLPWAYAGALAVVCAGRRNRGPSWQGPWWHWQRFIAVGFTFPAVTVLEAKLPTDWV